MATRRCLACGESFPLRPQSPNQAYCSAAACQRDRRKLWQRERRRSDSDYRENQANAHDRWILQHPDYWKAYRLANPDYVARNREQQRERVQRKRSPAVANMDSSTPSLGPGVYRLVVLAPAQAEVANIDSWIVKITLISAG